MLLKKHVPLITQSLSVTEPIHTPCARLKQLTSLLSANETPCKYSKSSATLQCSWQVPDNLFRSDLQDEKTNTDMCTALNSDQGKTDTLDTLGPRVQRQMLNALYCMVPGIAQHAAQMP